MKAQATYYPSERHSPRPALRHAGQAGRLRAHTQFIREHQDIVYNLAYRILGDADLAATATEDIFQRALSALSESGHAPPKLWLLRIAVAVWQQHLGRTAEPAPNPRDAWPGDRHQESMASTHDCRPPSEQIQAQINTLPPEQRVTLVLSDVGGLSYREIAEVTGVSVDLIRSRLSQGRTALRDGLLNSQGLSAIR